ncbi:hypothetical protein BD311DRAFT_746878 [Dichomitus squalens]|uniref:Uncharacterized protein n=1 Tax=Dichomitus squalens TaxID=114155 RepID=A0A4Q9N0L1_9APHY|nr:hypothetical protein BD311DRAFT_746878 [Dichomitus squalens]
MRTARCTASTTGNRHTSCRGQIIPVIILSTLVHCLTASRLHMVHVVQDRELYVDLYMPS